MAFILRLMAAATLLATLGIAARAEDYPSRPVKIIVPFAAGGSADVYARILAQNLTESLKQRFVVEDKPGSGALIGTQSVAQSPADGYTLLMMSNTHTVNESLIANKPYELMKDFRAVAAVNSADLVMVVYPGVAAKTLGEFIALAKAQPGGLNYASSGPGTPYHMAGELFKYVSGTNIVHIPYSGSSGARNDVMGGHVQMMFDAITTMVGAIRGGQLRALMTSGAKRSRVLPDVPTAEEAGLKGFDATIWLGLMAPAQTPKSVVDKLNAAVNDILKRPDIEKAWSEQGAEPTPMTVEAFDAYLRKDIAKWANLVKTANIKVD